MRTACLAVALLIILQPAASGQRLYWGAIGGTGLTSDFPGYSTSAPADVYGNPAYTFAHLPGSRSFILGGLLEVQLIGNLAIEADILHRPLPAISTLNVFPAGGPSVTTTNKFLAANTWEFPVMLKMEPALPAGTETSPAVPRRWARLPHLPGRPRRPTIAIRDDCRGGCRLPIWQAPRGAHHPVHAVGKRRRFSVFSDQGRSA